MSEYGRVAIAADEWLNELVQPILTHGLPPLPPSVDRLCRPRVFLRRFDPTEARDPHNGKWVSIGGGIDAPDLGALYKLDNFEEYDKIYNVFDETDVSVAGGDYSITAVSMTNGEAQIAIDTKSHRYVLADTDAAGMRDLADTFESMLESWNHIDQESLDSAAPGELVDYQAWQDGDIQIGYDAAGDFRITPKDTGLDVPLPELSPDDVQHIVDALHQQADNADQQEG